MLVLNLGAGPLNRPTPLKLLGLPEDAEVLRLDADPDNSPTLVCRLGSEPVPLPDESVDVAVAFHVLEHIGKQGETEEWFAFWEDLYRVLKPEGRFIFESPLATSMWAWADPTHSRALVPAAFLYFDQDSYRISESEISPYRIQCDFKSKGFQAFANANPDIAKLERYSFFRGELVAQKPLKPWWEDASYSS